MGSKFSPAVEALQAMIARLKDARGLSAKEEAELLNRSQGTIDLPANYADLVGLSMKPDDVAMRKLAQRYGAKEWLRGESGGVPEQFDMRSTHGYPHERMGIPFTDDPAVARSYLDRIDKDKIHSYVLRDAPTEPNFTDEDLGGRLSPSLTRSFLSMYIPSTGPRAEMQLMPGPAARFEDPASNAVLLRGIFDKGGTHHPGDMVRRDGMTLYAKDPGMIRSTDALFDPDLVDLPFTRYAKGGKVKAAAKGAGNSALVGLSVLPYADLFQSAADTDFNLKDLGGALTDKQFYKDLAGGAYDAGLGVVSGALGAPGELEGVGRVLANLLPGVDISEESILPDNKYVQSKLPMRAEPNPYAVNAGELLGGLYSGPGSGTRAIESAASTARALPRIFAESVLQPSTVSVIKNKGGNWLAGDVEKTIAPLRSPFQDISELRAKLTAMAADPQTTRAEAATRQLADVERRHSVNNWLDKKLAKYIKNELATPEDPIRALAERGILHTRPRAVEGDGVQLLGLMRADQGFPPEGLASSRLAKDWESRADFSIFPRTTKKLIDTKNSEAYFGANPWLLKVPPETIVNSTFKNDFGDLGFNHLTDELRNAIDPNSGLPADLLWKYTDLDKVSVPQAVERVAKINEWRAKNLLEANAAKARNAATVPFKDYPDSDYQWVELRKPDDVEMPQYNNRDQSYSQRGIEIDGQFYDVPFDPKDSTGQSSREAVAKAAAQRRLLSDALKYEGDTMGHCVGGYCDDVASGRTKIYSLRNKKTGEPHVTVEVGSPEMRGGQSVEEFAATPKRIVQIKGKQNKAPVETYLPYVQDFVRSGQWSDVGDLQNTGLLSMTGYKSANPSVPDYLTQAEFDAWLASGKTGYAEGGIVAPDDALSYNVDNVDRIAASLQD